MPLADSKTQSGPPIVPEDPKESLRREVNTLFASIQKPAVMPKGWRSAASSAYETVRSRVAAGLGDNLVSADAIKCETNGCVARLQYRQLSGYQRALRVFDNAEELRPYPRAYTGPEQAEDGQVTNYVFLFLNPN